MDALKSGGFEFLRTVCADPKLLERISGIAALTANIDDSFMDSLIEENDTEEDMMASDGSADEESSS